MKSELGTTVPKVSIVLEPLTGTVGKDGSPAGCYGSICKLSRLTWFLKQRKAKFQETL